MKRRVPFKATCNRCQQESDRCLTVVLKHVLLGNRYRELANYCSECRRLTSGKWVWPVEPTGEVEPLRPPN